jgi:hypothetical protein
MWLIHSKEPSKYTLTKEKKMEFKTLFRTVGLLTVMSPLSLQTQAAVFQDNSANYIAFEAEKFDSLVRNQGENDGFNVVTINEFVSENRI